MAKLVFIHGLNTYGDDDLHVGPLKFGTMYERVENALRSHGVDVVSLTNFGAGSPEEQAERAQVSLMKFDFMKSTPLEPIHLLGQSTGGLVARVLATYHEVKSQVKTVMTIGTPHHGTIAAEFGLEFENKYPKLRSLFAKAGYDTKAKLGIFRHYTPKAMAEFNRRYPLQSGVRNISLICDIERGELSLPLRFFYEKLHSVPLAFSGAEKGCSVPFAASDGFIWCKSQRWGEEVGPFHLDHFGQLGYFLQTRPKSREKSQSEFQRLTEKVYQLISN